MRIPSLPLLAAGVLALAATGAIAQPLQLHTAQASSLAAADLPSDRDTYTRKADDDMRTWQQKMHDFGETTEVEGKQVGKSARDGLATAWTNTQIESRKLRDATAEGWQAAKHGFERASHNLSEAWDKRGTD